MEEDEKEKGCRKLLNFGHTYGHALEKICGYTTYSHGQAVAIGMNYITICSESEGISAAGISKRIENLCKIYNLPVSCNAVPSEIKDAVLCDKKNVKGGIEAVFLKDIGESFVRLVSADYFAKEVYR